VGEPPTSGYAFWLLGLFAVSIGLPFFALAANNPLLQAWFVRTLPSQWPGPILSFYASSNIGQFSGACVPIRCCLSPMSRAARKPDLDQRLWIAHPVDCQLAGVLLLRSPIPPAAETLAEDIDAAGAGLDLARTLDFSGRVPSGLLIAVTGHISTDVAAAPLLWVLRCPLYLLTWVLVFQSRRCCRTNGC